MGTQVRPSHVNYPGAPGRPMSMNELKLVGVALVAAFILGMLS